MKKLKPALVVLVCLTIALILGCSTQKVIQPENTSKELAKREVNSKGKEDAEKFKYIEYDAIESCLKLIDWNSNTKIKEIKLKKNELGFKTFKFNQGYGVVIFIAEKPTEIKINKAGYKSIDIPKTFVRKVLRIYDSELNLSKEIDLEQVFTKDNLDSVWSADISLNGNKMILASQQSLFVYNIESNDLIKVFNKSNPKSINFSNVHFDEEAKSIVFIGFSPQDRETSKCYGIIELGNGNIIDFHEAGYEQASGINISNPFACITDSIDPGSQMSDGRGPYS